jgi:hypothetical protein
MRPVPFVLVVATIIFSFASLQAQIVLDEVMSKDDQKKTGVANLNKNQKIALEAWLNNNFILKTEPEAPETPLSLSINIDNGKKIQLSDNSIWEVSPSDLPTSALWLTPFPVKITPSGDPNYPSLIVNLNSGVSVKARCISAPTPSSG